MALTDEEVATLQALLAGCRLPQFVLVTGSRTWTDEAAVAEAMSMVEDRASVASWPLTLRHGAARGLDRLATRWAEGRDGWLLDPHPAAWGRYGKPAGMIRNAEMVKAGADVCLAFIVANSSGASGCADLAERAGIPTWRCHRD